MPVITYREALRQALREEMQRDDGVFVIGEEVAQYQGTFRVTEDLLAEFGERRVLDTPISEEGFTGLAIGAAMLGLRPIVEYMTLNFGILALDQIINHAAKMRYMSGGQFSVPMVVRGPGGPGVQLSAQHSQSLEAWFAHVPGLKVALPSTPADAKGMLKSAIRDPDPVIFVEHAMLYQTRGEVPEGEYLVPLGQAVVRRPGRDVTLVSYSRMANLALKAADLLAEEGIEAEVIDVRCLRPLDIETVAASVRRTHRAVVADEAWRPFGPAAELASRIYEECFDDLDAPVERVCGVDVPMPYARNLEKLAVPDVPELVAAVKRASWRSSQATRGGEETNGTGDDAENGRRHGGGDARPVAQAGRRSG